jgi:hypothetical protein
VQLLVTANWYVGIDLNPHELKFQEVDKK